MCDEMEMQEGEFAETIVKLAEENQTRKILALLKESGSLEEATQKVKALLEK